MFIKSASFDIVEDGGLRTCGRADGRTGGPAVGRGKAGAIVALESSMPLPYSSFAISLITASSLLTAGCKAKPAPDIAAITAANNASAAPPIGPVVMPPSPLRDAVGNHDLRTLIAEVATKTACDEIRGQFRGMRDPADPKLITGALWIRTCNIKNNGTNLDIELTGHGWLWVAQTAKKAGGTFAVKQDVRFALAAGLRGQFDVAYHEASHVISLWFSPTAAPKVALTPFGEIDVDAQGAWSSVLGTLGSVFANSPESKARAEVKTIGTRETHQQLADGLSVTVDACTGLRRVGLGRLPKGEMHPADETESEQVFARLQPSGLLVLGPYPAPRGLSLQISVPTGTVRTAMMCAEHAELMADAYLNRSEFPTVPLLSVHDVRGTMTLKTKATGCPVVIVARVVGNGAGPAVDIAWRRTRKEAARATGGGLIDCPAPSATPPAANGAAATQPAPVPKAPRKKVPATQLAR